MASDLDTEFDPDDWSSAEQMIAQLRERIAVSPEEWDAMTETARLRAFKVSGVADLDMVARVWEGIDKAVEEGETLEDFRERIGEALESEWGIDGSQLETIFRTNVHQAYAAGRAALNARVKDTHPYVRFSVDEDDRTCPICEPLTNVVLPQDDDFVATHQPPLHCNCRCDVIAVMEDEAKEYGIDETGPVESEPAEGFGGDPLGEFDPDLSTRPAELASLFELKELGL